MKSTERHRLKENEFARTVARARELIDTRRRDMTAIAIVLVAAILLAGGYGWWRHARDSKANTVLAAALAVAEAPVVAPTPPAPGSPIPVQQPGTFQTEQAKLEAALPKFLEVADKYPNTDAGITARYRAAGILASLGRLAEAEQRFQEVIDKAGSRIYGRTARLGLAEVQIAEGKYDNAIKILQELSTDSKSEIPVDAVLMELGRAYMKAGKKNEAAHAFTRVVNEFPLSLYVTDARREMEEAKKS
jgi:predicted negative regulator of RcsB-dependent stress response